MRIYLAARYELYPVMQNYRDQLRELGYEVTSRWIEGGHSAIGAPLDARTFAQHDVDDLKAADCIVLFAEDPAVGVVRGGRHVEFGMALAWGKRLIVVNYRENVFHHLPQVEYYETWWTAFQQLVREMVGAEAG